MRQALIVSMVLVSAAPVFGRQSPQTAPPLARFGELRPPQATDPYQRLFAARQALKSAVEQDRLSKPTVVCGMLIVPADPTIDPKMAVTPPQNPTLEYKIRVWEPPVCKPAK